MKSWDWVTRYAAKHQTSVSDAWRSWHLMQGPGPYEMDNYPLEFGDDCGILVHSKEMALSCLATAREAIESGSVNLHDPTFRLWLDHNKMSTNQTLLSYSVAYIPRMALAAAVYFADNADCNEPSSED